MTIVLDVNFDHQECSSNNISSKNKNSQQCVNNDVNDKKAKSKKLKKSSSSKAALKVAKVMSKVS
jgi:hypothetical protein